VKQRFRTKQEATECKPYKARLMCAIIKANSYKSNDGKKLNVWPVVHILDKQITNWKETDILTLTQTIYKRHRTKMLKAKRLEVLKAQRH